jgi:ABC-2 type transport system permease protein
MSVATTTSTQTGNAIVASEAGFFRDIASIGRRAITGALRDPEALIPAVIIPAFFYTVNLGALRDYTEANSPGLDFAAFQLPVAIIFAVTGISRASTLVIDIQSGYLDRLLMTPVRRSALLLGFMVADLLTIAALCVPVLLLGAVFGVKFATGIVGMLLFVFIGAAWGWAFSGIPYAIALKTGSPAAVNSSFILFFPFAFLTSAFIPAEALTGWLQTVARYNPTTYVLDGLRSVVLEGWNATAMFQCFLAIAGVAAVSMTMASLAMRGRLRKS